MAPAGGFAPWKGKEEEAPKQLPFFCRNYWTVYCRRCKKFQTLRRPMICLTNADTGRNYPICVGCHDDFYLPAVEEFHKSGDQSMFRKEFPFLYNSN